MQGRVDIEAGICLHTTTAVAASEDMRMVTFSIETSCPNIERLAEGVARGQVFDAYHEIDTRVEGDIVAAGRTARACTDCVVPVSLIKALRIAADLAMVKDVSISLAQDKSLAPA
jgi:Family of unknown function (DUF6951)